ncbi:MAG: hypothetical protein KDI69_04795 [Xanthomonadales bacterium]|nr:hypothetical protein [Xanthomonadales bacterium]
MKQRSWALAALVIASSAPWAQDHPGKGPIGHDNGAYFACTGVTSSGLAVICVRNDGSGNGSQANPMGSIQAAIDAAKAGDVIAVAAGTYVENPVLGSETEYSSKNLTLLGGYASDFGSRDAEAFVTTIDGGLTARVMTFYVIANAESRIDGFVVTHGVTSTATGNSGGGIHAEQMGSGPFVISHNLIVDYHTDPADNEAHGGGILANAVDWDGGEPAIVIEHNTVSNNTAGKGGGLTVAGHRIVLRQNLIENNQGSNDHGGGVYVSSASTLISNNIIRNNAIGAIGWGWGGGMVIPDANADLEGNVFAGNYSPSLGSQLFWDEGASGTMRNELLYGSPCNQAGEQASMLYIDGGSPGGSHVVIDNMTLADYPNCPNALTQQAIFVQADSSAVIRNSILWNVGTEFTTIDNATYTITHSLTGETGVGNFLNNPRFVDSQNGDYHLQSIGGHYTANGWVNDATTSPAIDAGNPASSFANEPAPNGGRINLGAFGNTAQASRNTVSPDDIFANGFES